ncbi:MAG: Sjogren's syndrome/scleroderma autoantigen 1 family protein [Candidatus Bathyarchaeia archaeon]
MPAELKRMSDLLKSGATMMSEACPECGSPLFKVGSDIICAKCNKPVVILRAAEEESKIIGSRILDDLEQTVLSKIREMNSIISSEGDVERLTQYGRALSTWLETLEKVKRLRSG